MLVQSVLDMVLPLLWILLTANQIRIIHSEKVSFVYFFIALWEQRKLYPRKERFDDLVHSFNRNSHSQINANYIYVSLPPMLSFKSIINSRRVDRVFGLRWQAVAQAAHNGPKPHAQEELEW